MKENSQNCSYQRNAFGVRKLACALIHQCLATGTGISPRQSGSKLPRSKANFATVTNYPLDKEGLHLGSHGFKMSEPRMTAYVRINAPVDADGFGRRGLDPFLLSCSLKDEPI